MRLNRLEVIGGVVIMAIGAFAVWEASAYPVGRLTRMGPGYFPIVLGALMIALGLGIIAENWRSRHQVSGPPLFALFGVFASLAAFALLVDRFGIVPAGLAAVLIASLAERRLSPAAAVVLGIVLCTLAYVVFVWALGLPLRAFRWP